MGDGSGAFLGVVYDTESGETMEWCERVAGKWKRKKNRKENRV